MIEPEMRTYLQDSTRTTGNFYLKVAPQKAAPPYGVVFKVSPGKRYTHGGAAGLSESRLQCSCYSTIYLTAKTYATTVIEAMEYWPVSTSTANVQAVFLAGETDLEENNHHHVALDFWVWHGE